MTQSTIKARCTISNYTVRRRFSGQRTARDVVAALVSIHR